MRRFAQVEAGRALRPDSARQWAHEAAQAICHLAKPSGVAARREVALMAPRSARDPVRGVWVRCGGPADEQTVNESSRGLAVRTLRLTRSRRPAGADRRSGATPASVVRPIDSPPPSDEHHRLGKVGYRTGTSSGSFDSDCPEASCRRTSQSVRRSGGTNSCSGSRPETALECLCRGQLRIAAASPTARGGRGSRGRRRVMKSVSVAALHVRRSASRGPPSGRPNTSLGP